LFARSRSGVRWVILALVGLLTTATLAPLPTLAQDASLAPGTVATNTAGETLLIRSTPGWDGAAAGEVAPGAQVTVSDYPVTAADGSLWYPVGGGYLPATALSTGATTDTMADASGVTDQASGYYDDTGAWVDTTAQAEPTSQASGYLDQNGNWVDTSGQTAPTESSTGYLDEYGNWVDTTAAATTQAAPVDGSSGYYDEYGNWVDTTGQNPSASGDTMVYNDASGASNTNNTAAPAAAPIGTAYIAGTNGDGAICRTAADWASAELGVVPEGSAVEVTGGTVGEWQPVNCNGVSGYVHASFVSWDAPVTADTTLTATGDTSVSETPSGYRNNRNNRRGNNSNNGGSSGQQIANFASGYLGYPYVYAGAGPNAFDCSGFTMFVVQNTLGMDITHSVPTQYSMGTPVSRNQLQPGDLVFFENTFEPGLSHVGIYVGNGQFIHAENAGTGVVISDLNSDYYSSHYYGAVRLA
jgi:cell wall-associated NlpC family hydrolase